MVQGKTCKLASFNSLETGNRRAAFARIPDVMRPELEEPVGRGGRTQGVRGGGHPGAGESSKWGPAGREWSGRKRGWEQGKSESVSVVLLSF